MTERLSAMDASFLAHAKPEHLLGVRLLVFPGPAPGFNAFLDHVHGRLPLAPRLRQRVRRGALELRRPRWVDDRGLDVTRHVRPMQLPSADCGSDLESLSAALLNAPMALDRPLWELRYIEGLPDGRFAAGVRFHHSLGDGNANTSLLAELFPPLAGVGPSIRSEPGRARRSPGVDPARAVKRGALRLERRVASLHPRRLRRRARRRAQAIALARRSTAAALDRPVRVDRSVRLLSVPLADLRHARQAFDATLNNLVVAAVAGALRRTAIRRGAPALNSFALIAVSVRRAGEPELGNRAASIRCELPIAEPDARERLRRVTDSLSAAVSAARAMGAPADVIGPQLWRDYLTRHEAQEAPPFDLIITNTRGSAVPLSCCGRQAEEILLSGPTVQFDGPVIRVSSYLDSLTIAITVDPARMADSGALAVDLHSSLDELLALARHSAGDAGHSSGGAWIGTPWPRSLTSSP